MCTHRVNSYVQYCIILQQQSHPYAVRMGVSRPKSKAALRRGRGRRGRPSPLKSKHGDAHKGMVHVLCSEATTGTLMLFTMERAGRKRNITLHHGEQSFIMSQQHPWKNFLPQNIFHCIMMPKAERPFRQTHPTVFSFVSHPLPSPLFTPLKAQDHREAFSPPSGRKKKTRDAFSP